MRGPSALLLLLLVLMVVLSLESLNDVRAAINGVSDTHISIFSGPAANASVSAKAATALEQRTAARAALEQRTAARAAALGRCINSGSQVGTTDGSNAGGGAAVVPEEAKCCEGKDDFTCFRPLLREAGYAVEADRALTPGLGADEPLLFDDMAGGGAGNWLP